MSIDRWISAAGWLLLVAAGSGFARSDDLKPYPPAEPGMKRWVIRLAAVPAPEERRLEVIVGRTIEVDCNRLLFSVTVKREIAQGWGFPYYVLGELKGPATTLMACPPDFVKRKEFVRANADALAWLPYNAKLPIIVYAPVNTEVRYRIWSAGDATVVSQPE